MKIIFLVVFAVFVCIGVFFTRDFSKRQNGLVVIGLSFVGMLLLAMIIETRLAIGLLFIALAVLIIWQTWQTRKLYRSKDYEFKALVALATLFLVAGITCIGVALI